MITLKNKATEERGAAALLLVISGVTAGLMVLVIWALPLAGASSQQSKSQSAADAAALAGADAVVGGLGDILKGLGNWDGSFSGMATIDGADRAAAYAEENGAKLINYQGPSSGNDWTVSVRVRRIVDGEEYETTARAKLDLPSCSSETEEPEPTTPPPDEDDEDEDEDDDSSDPEEPPPPPNNKLKCEGMPLFTIIEGDLGQTNGWAGFVDALLGGSHAKLTD